MEGEMFMGGKHTLGKRILSFGLSTAIVFTGTFSGMGSLTRVKAANPEDGLKLYYDFVLQNSFATEINDASGNMNSGQIARVNGKPEGNYEIHDVNLYGKEVKALKLPGGTDGTYLKLPDNVLNQSEDATISMWVRLTTDTAYQRIWDIGTGTSKYICSQTERMKDLKATLRRSPQAAGQRRRASARKRELRRTAGCLPRLSWMAHRCLCMRMDS